MPHHSAVRRAQPCAVRTVNAGPGSRPSSASTGRRSDPVPGWRLRADPGVSDGSENPSVKRHVEGQGEMGKTWITWITNDTCGTQIVELTNRITWFSPGITLGIDLSTNFKERIEFLARTWGFKQQRWGHLHTFPHKNADRIDPSRNGKWICVGVFCHHFFQKDMQTVANTWESYGNHHAHGEICCNHEGNQWLKDQMTRSWAAAPHDGPSFFFDGRKRNWNFASARKYSTYSWGNQSLRSMAIHGTDNFGRTNGHDDPNRELKCDSQYY